MGSLDDSSTYRPRVCYLVSPALISASNALPSNIRRSQMVHSLVYHMGLLDLPKEETMEGPNSKGGSSPRSAEAAKESRPLIELLGGADPDAEIAWETSESDRAQRGQAEFNEDRQISRAVVVEPDPACSESLKAFHSGTYVDVLLATKEEQRSIDDEACGLVDDCYRFPELPDHVKAIAGGSISAARCLATDTADIAIHWDGGRHHAHKSRAAGFCYVNDVVLAILELRKPRKIAVQAEEERSSEVEDEPIADKCPTSSSRASATTLGFGTRPEDIRLALGSTSGKSSKRAATVTSQPAKKRRTMIKRLERILYLDLDLHWGDGVEEAFTGSSSVLTLSIHNQAPGFYPSAPDPFLDSKNSIGNTHALRLPLQPGAGFETWKRVWTSCVKPVMVAYEPAAIVMQCGLDGLAGDPMKQWNLDLKSILCSVESVLKYARGRKGVKVLLLGGGGYQSANAARGWAAITALALGRLVLEETLTPSPQASLPESKAYDDIRTDAEVSSKDLLKDYKDVTGTDTEEKGDRQSPSRGKDDFGFYRSSLENSSYSQADGAQPTSCPLISSSKTLGAYTVWSPIPDAVPDWPLYGAAATLDVPASDSLDLLNDQAYLTKVEKSFQSRIDIFEKDKAERESKRTMPERKTVMA